MTTTTEQLQALADAWAAKLGGKLPVSIRASVYAGPSDDRHPYFSAQIGETGGACWTGYGPELEAAILQAEKRWQFDGSPTDVQDCERAKLRVRAAELGLTVF